VCQRCAAPYCTYFVTCLSLPTVVLNLFVVYQSYFLNVAFLSEIPPINLCPTNEANRLPRALDSRSGDCSPPVSVAVVHVVSMLKLTQVHLCGYAPNARVAMYCQRPQPSIAICYSGIILKNKRARSIAIMGHLNLCIIKPCAS
jgi:hypothetical protein